jgi:hypothetical protein
MAEVKPAGVVAVEANVSCEVSQVWEDKAPQFRMRRLVKATKPDFSVVLIRQFDLPIKGMVDLVC